MFVLLTGAFGNIGESTLIPLLAQNHRVRCFDLHTKQNQKLTKKLHRQGEFETVWGDVRNSDTVRNIVEDVE
ncbi:MAG: NAD-dependent epimerase/dehydratase family protein [Candidatus Hermodarchaeia archaeon]